MIDFNERAIALSAVAKVIHIVVTGPLAVEELDALTTQPCSL
jgi:hypothetical protein